ncbi:DHBP synthase RibB-like alpha/beta domain-containing protein [Xylariaceae sp. FL0804]|nr:DHBP synthase RibB-like alpha/beta domain-containing protein [Xylariaceae sp. FL0804]
MALKTIPLPDAIPNVERDAREAFEVLRAGGVVIAPTEVGYALMASSSEGIERAFTTKRRRQGHALGVIGTHAQHAALHCHLGPEMLAMTRALTLDLGQTLAVVARCPRDNPRLVAAGLGEAALDRSTVGDTLGVAISEGAFMRELGRLCDAEGRLVVGSSANLSGEGQKFRVEDIEPEVRDAADLVVDYGLQRYYRYGRAGTVLDLDGMRVLRFGAGYELLRDKVYKWWSVKLPEDPELGSMDGSIGIGLSVKAE